MAFGVGAERMSKEMSREEILRVCKPRVQKAGSNNTAYISLAGPQYYDSVMMHEQLGIPYDAMASAEHGGEGKLKGWNNALWARFSKPTRKFQLREEFKDISMAPYRKKALRIIWYDSVNTSEPVLEADGPAQHIFNEMVTPGSLVFFTFIEANRTMGTDVMQRRSAEMKTNFGGTEANDVYRRFCEKCFEASRDAGYGLNVVLGHLYQSWPSGQVFVVGFEVLDESKLVNNIELQLLPFVDRSGDPVLTTLEKMRLALMVKKYFVGLKIIRWDGLDTPTGIPYQIINAKEIKQRADALTEEDVAGIMEEFPLDFIKYVEDYEETEEDVRTEDECKKQLATQIKRLRTMMDNYIMTANVDPVEYSGRMMKVFTDYIETKETNSERLLGLRVSWIRYNMENAMSIVSGLETVSEPTKEAVSRELQIVRSQINDIIRVYCQPVATNTAPQAGTEDEEKGGASVVEAEIPSPSQIGTSRVKSIQVCQERHCSALFRKRCENHTSPCDNRMDFVAPPMEIFEGEDEDTEVVDETIPLTTEEEEIGEPELVPLSEVEHPEEYCQAVCRSCGEVVLFQPHLLDFVKTTKCEKCGHSDWNTEYLVETPETLRTQKYDGDVKKHVDILEEAVISLGGSATNQDVYHKYAEIVGHEITEDKKGAIRSVLYSGMRHGKRRFRKVKDTWTLGRGSMRYKECRSLKRQTRRKVRRSKE